MNPPPKGTATAGEAPSVSELTRPASSARPIAADSADLARNLYELHNWLNLKRR